MKTYRKDAGFSIAELLIAMLAASILLLIIGSMLIFCFRGWSKNSKWIDLQEDLTVSEFSLERWIRQGSYQDTLVDGSSITITGTSKIVSFSLNGSDLIFDPDLDVTGDEMTLINGRVVEFTPERTLSGIDIQLKLKEGDQNVETHHFIHFRNQ